MAAACSGNSQSLTKLLCDSPNALALSRVRDDKGVSLLGLAIPNGRRDVVEYLLTEGGSDPNVSDNRTLLMEAALWGHPGLVELLLRHGADNEEKDKRGRVAVDFTEDSEQNQQERHKRSPKYSEDPFTKEKDRELIRALLGPMTERPSPRSIRAAHLVGAYFRKSLSAGTISLVVPSCGIEIQQPRETTALLARDGPYPLLAAVSGRISGVPGPFRASDGEFALLNESYWGGNATIFLAREIGFVFAPHENDPVGRPWSYYASHAEAQLMCYFVRKNYLFRRHTAEPVRDDFLQLFLLQPRIQAARMILSQLSCNSCWMFRNHIEAVLDINFTLDVLPVKYAGLV